MNIKHSIISAFLIVIFLYSFTGCRSYVKPVDQAICETKLQFIQDDKTTKGDVTQNINEDIVINIQKLKNDKIWIYRLRYDENKTSNLYDLVLVFDENGLLKKHSLVKIR